MTQSQRHSLNEWDSRQAIQARPDHPKRVIPPSRGLPVDLLVAAPASSGPVCHQFNNKLPQFASPVPDSMAWAVDALRLPWEDLDQYVFPPVAILGKVVEKLQHYPCRRIIHHALVLGASGHVKPNPIVSAQPAPPVDSTIPSNPSQESVKPESPCLAPRAPALKEQAFFEAVAARIEAPQRVSTRSIYDANWTIFTKWCHSNQVDFKLPYKVHSRLPVLSVPRQEVAAKYH